MRSFQHKLSIARGLSGPDWANLIQAWWILLYFNLALRFFSLEKLNAGKPDQLMPPPHLETATNLQHLVSLASRLHLPPAACLSRAFTLQRMLAKRSIPSNLCIGVNRLKEDFHAHAWVEVDGQAIGEPGDIQETFRVLKPADASVSKNTPAT